MSSSIPSYSRLKASKEFFLQFIENKGAFIGLLVTLFFCLIALLCPLLMPHNPSKIFDNAFSLPAFWSDGSDPRFLLGTDDLGRDLLSRLISGSRISMGVGLLIVVLSTTMGTFVGMVSGYVGGITDKVVMRMVDILMALPSILLAIVVVAILGPGLLNAIIAVSFVSLPGIIRIVRASVLSEKTKDYVTAAKTFGASHFRLMFIHIFPNCSAPLIVQMALSFSDGILNTAALGFLGLGAQPPAAEWGTMLSDARAFIEHSPSMVTLPGLCILITVLGFNLLGDGLRDTLDPRLKK